jgi:purine-nucleoside phosphorylase
MPQTGIYRKIKESVEAIRSRCSLEPEIGIIIGSGLGGLVKDLDNPTVIPYCDIPHFHGTTTEGQSGQLTLGLFHGVPAVFLKGRCHLYEGYPMEDVVYPTRTICGLGIKTIIISSAAGGLNPEFEPGDLMLLKDHINLMGDNPLKGSQIAQLGPRFPDLSQAYSLSCNEILQKAASTLGIRIHQGVYAGMLGPTYETPAEVRMLKIIGADAVGMSAVPESIAANHLGVQVIGLMCITNRAAGLSDKKLTHQDVIENSKATAAMVSRLLAEAIPQLVHKPTGSLVKPSEGK